MLEAVTHPCKEHTWLLTPLASAYAKVGRADDAKDTVKTILSFEFKGEGDGIARKFSIKEDFACPSPYSETRQAEVVKALKDAELPEGPNCPED